MIEVNKLTKTYDRRTRTANTVLHDVTITLPDRGFVCILGPSGCGKTSLLNAIGGLDTFDSGRLTVDGVSVTKYGVKAFELARDRNFGYIFQNYYLLSDHSVAYNVYMGLHCLGLSHAQKIQRVKTALRAVDMERYIHRKVEELSGGQQQRVAIARALARRPRVIFADEPTGNLDEENTRAVCTLLRRASRESLVVMVTHEESIARFFADRIITLSDGYVTSDRDSWERGGLTASTGSTIYTGELEEERPENGLATLRVLREPGAPPTELTVAVLRDRIVLKISDKRAVTVGKPEDVPTLVEGKRPTVDLADVDKAGEGDTMEMFREAPAAPARPGKGITLPMMVREAWRLRKDGKIRRVGTAAFLVLLTVLILLTAGDYIKLANIDPRDFLTSDPHMLMVDIRRGGSLRGEITEQELQFAVDFDQALKEEGLEVDFIPHITGRCLYTSNLFFQLEDFTLEFPSAMCWASADRLDPATLIFGRMPEKNYEMVVDRQVLEIMLESDSIALNGVVTLQDFVGAEIQIMNRSYSVTICGVADSGARTAYISKSALLALCNGNARILSLKELQALYPGEYDDVTLGRDECLLNATVAGSSWETSRGGLYRPGGSGPRYLIKDVIHIDDPHYAVILSDEGIDYRYLTVLFDNFQIYCQDKPATMAFAQKFARDYPDNSIVVEVTDRYGEQRMQFEEAASVRLNARSIVTATVMALCMVMLYLLCRTQVRDRLGLVAVYRLLGIPGRKLYFIFMMEAFFSSLTAVIPAALLTWGSVEALHLLTTVADQILLPWYAAALTVLGIVVFFLIASVLPLMSVLRLPPARLAAKYE